MCVHVWTEMCVRAVTMCAYVGRCMCAHVVCGHMCSGGCEHTCGLCMSMHMKSVEMWAVDVCMCWLWKRVCRL